MSDQTIINLLTEIRDLLKSGCQPSAQPKPRIQQADTSDEVVVSDIVTDCGQWGDCVIRFGKHAGTELRSLPVSYIQWMSKNWQGKGYETDKHIEACIAAVMGGGVNTEATAMTDSKPAYNAPKAEVVEDDNVPF